MINEMNKRIKNLSVWDIGLTKAAVFCFAVIIVKLLPVILTIRIRIWIVLLVLLAAKPLWVFLINRAGLVFESFCKTLAFARSFLSGLPLFIRQRDIFIAKVHKSLAGELSVPQQSLFIQFLEWLVGILIPNVFVENTRSSFC